MAIEIGLAAAQSTAGIISFSTNPARRPGNFPVLPLRTRTRGPAYTLPPLPPNVSDLDVPTDSESYDCVDEILSLFRANVLFRNFEINGPADRMLIYGTLFITECLGKVRPNMSSLEASKVRPFWLECMF